MEIDIQKHKLDEIKLRDKHSSKYGGFPYDDVRYKRPLFNDIEINAILRLVDPINDEIIADLGCGIGRFTTAMSNRGCKVISIDFSFESLKKLRKETDNPHSLIQGDICALPIDDRTINKVLSVLVLQHIPTEEEMIGSLKEMRRILKDNGKIVVSVLQNKNGENIKVKLSKNLNLYCTLFNTKYLSSLAERANMHNIRIYFSNINQRIFNRIAYYCQKYKIAKKIWINFEFFLSNFPLLNRYCEYLILKCEK